MENKTHRNIFESAFESFELDNEFIFNLEDDLRKHKKNIEDKKDEKKFNHATVYKSEVSDGNKVDDKMKHSEDITLLLDDLNESDFFERTSSRNQKNSLKVTIGMPNNETKDGLPNNKAIGCLSPILLPKQKNRVKGSFSSTPLKPNSSLIPEEKKKAEKSEENSQKISEYGFLEADLFDDWDIEGNSQKDSITLSQAFKLIEEAESARESKQKENLNNSIDLFTGRPVGDNVEGLFDESFSVSNIIENKQKKDSSDDCLIGSEESDSGSKFPLIQKLNFKTKTDGRKNNFGIDFNSDDDFDFLTQELLNKPKCAKTLIELKSFSSDESSESVIKKRNCCRIIESDSADDSTDSKFNKKRNKKKNRRPKNFERNVANEFIESEAEVSDIVEVSSDESEEEGEYDASFVDEELYLTQNSSANMTAKYLESVKNPDRPGGFKIPPAKAYIPAFVFSQIPEDSNTEYELDSFCVNEVEEEMKTDLSDLEIAEKILEMDRKKKKRKRILQRSMKIK